ncbi:caspase family protein [Nocardia salmonicida]|uniref:caspase, EACC1-associated type n=1 Tax=Nocardia salmonicida TaxID=53431 RepID=UPI0037A64657
MTTPPRRGSRAVLIGTATYTNPQLTAIPAALNNLTDLSTALTSAGGAFAPEHCFTLPDPVSGEQIGDALVQAAGEATDVLFVYYAGHGVLDSRGRFYLTVTGTDPTRPSWKAVPFQTLREEILESRATARILILDCCYSGRAFEAMSDTASVIAGETSIHGTYTITSSEANEPSFAPRGHRNTAFTAALLAAARTVDLTLDELYSRTSQHLKDHGHPRPRRRIVNTAGELKLFGDTREHQYRQASDTGRITPASTAAFVPQAHNSTAMAHTEGDQEIDASGDFAAMYDLGVLCRQHGDHDQAELWFRKAAGGGNSDAMFDLATSSRKSRAHAEAEAWFRKAALAGHARASNNLGILLRDRREAAEAEMWFRAAAQAGNASAMVNLAALLRKGNHAEADSWDQRARDASS